MLTQLQLSPSLVIPSQNKPSTRIRIFHSSLDLSKSQAKSKTRWLTRALNRVKIVSRMEALTKVKLHKALMRIKDANQILSTSNSLIITTMVLTGKPK